MVATTELRTKLTYEDYRNTPDDERYELIDGELIMSPSPREAHQYADVVLGSILYTFVNQRNLGRVYHAPFDVVLSDTDVVQPDLLFVSRERLHIITEDNIQGAPDLAVEILSPSTSARDRGYKRDLYAKHGVKEYWQVDTDAKQITVLSLNAHGDYDVVAVYGVGQTLASPLLPGFALNLDEIF